MWRYQWLVLKLASSLDPVNLLSLCFGYNSPIVKWDSNSCNVTEVLNSRIIRGRHARGWGVDQPGNSLEMQGLTVAMTCTSWDASELPAPWHCVQWTKINPLVSKFGPWTIRAIHVLPVCEQYQVGPHCKPIQHRGGDFEVLRAAWRTVD